MALKVPLARARKIISKGERGLRVWMAVSLSILPSGESTRMAGKPKCCQRSPWSVWSPMSTPAGTSSKSQRVAAMRVWVWW